MVDGKNHRVARDADQTVGRVKMTTPDKDVFLAAVAESANDATLARITLGKYRGTSDAQKVVVTPVTIKGAPHLKFVTSHARKDITQNYAIAEAVQRLASLIGEDYLSATLFTAAKDLTLQFTKKKATTLTRGKPTFASVPAADHNRAKNYIVDATKPYLHALGVTQTDGAVKPSMYPKFKQICHFVEIVDQLIRESDLEKSGKISVTDIGSGKGYLTFALYDHLTSALGKAAEVKGIEVRADMVALCQRIATDARFTGLTFDETRADQAPSRASDVIIALHACDTATDDAIYQGISKNAALIVVAPCCQHELAPQLAKAADALTGITKFGLFKQRQADLVTDAARCLLLEASGYSVKVIEFVSTEHTAKNILIAAIRSSTADKAAARAQFEMLKTEMGFKTQRLATLLEM